MTRLRLALALAAAALGLFASSASAQPLALGFGDPLFQSPEAGTRELWLDTAAATGADLARLNVSWRGIAPAAPASDFDPTDPSSPGYKWSVLDAAVKSATAHGLRVLLTVSNAPSWAEGPARPKNMGAGTWMPDANAYGQFAAALATRYDGSFADPSAPGSVLPRVELFEAWNEPNLDTYLSPQWRGEELVGPGLYRPLLNHFFTAIKAVQPGATVIGGALAPFGDEPGGERTRPVVFLRSLLCLQGGALRPTSCPEKARFDVLSDHPIAVGPPTESALSPLDVTTPNLGRLTRVLRKAEATKRVLPAGQKPLWVTEFWYDTDPPDPNGIAINKQARWYEQDLYLFWKQGASAAIALQLRDAPEGKSYESTFQSGAYFVDGEPKPSRTALTFPIVGHRLNAFEVGVWGISPHRGKVEIQVLHNGTWKTAATVQGGGPGLPFTAKIRLYRFGKIRGKIGQMSSLPWSQP